MLLYIILFLIVLFCFTFKAEQEYSENRENVFFLVSKKSKIYDILRNDKTQVIILITLLVVIGFVLLYFLTISLMELKIQNLDSFLVKEIVPLQNGEYETFAIDGDSIFAKDQEGFYDTKNPITISKLEIASLNIDKNDDKEIKKYLVFIKKNFGIWFFSPFKKTKKSYFVLEAFPENISTGYFLK